MISGSYYELSIKKSTQRSGSLREKDMCKPRTA